MCVCVCSSSSSSSSSSSTMLVFKPDKDPNCALLRNLNNKTKKCFLSCVVEILTYRLRLEAMRKEIVMFLCEILGCR